MPKSRPMLALADIAKYHARITDDDALIYIAIASRITTRALDGQYADWRTVHFDNAMWRTLIATANI